MLLDLVTQPVPSVASTARIYMDRQKSKKALFGESNTTPEMLCIVYFIEKGEQLKNKSYIDLLLLEVCDKCFNGSTTEHIF